MTERNGYSPEEWTKAVLRLLWKIVFYISIISGALYLLYRLKTVLITLFIAGTIAYIIRPVASWLISDHTFILLHGAGRLNRHTLRIIASFYVLVLMFVVGWYAVRFTINPFVRETKRITMNWGTGNKHDMGLKMQKKINNVRFWYENHVSPEWRSSIQSQITQNQDLDEIKQRIGKWAETLIPKIGSLINYIVEIVLLPVLAFYFAIDSKKIKHEFATIVPNPKRKEVLRMIHIFNRIMVSYVVGQAILCMLAGIVVGIGLWALQMDYWLMLGILAGFTRAIPIVGPIIGGIPIILLAWSTKGIPVAVGVLIFFSFLHFAESKFIMPYLIGNRMKLHPVVVIVVLLIGQEFAGLLGMFFAAPIASLLREIAQRYWLKNHPFVRKNGGSTPDQSTAAAT
jgi:predicted PurR-regulated permease PerM